MGDVHSCKFTGSTVPKRRSVLLLLLLLEFVHFVKRKILITDKAVRREDPTPDDDST